ncbi:MAG: 50S ribosomal protein L21 [Phycisphaerae bacterium]|nr:50S ribosomal protein L21 [Phycisphaerae bacterium]
MYAIFEDGGKQYRVTQGDALLVETRALADGQTELTFDKVLMVGDGEQSRFGAPWVAGASVTARVTDQLKMPRVRSFKFRRRKGVAVRKGHRQPALRVEITGIKA